MKETYISVNSDLEFNVFFDGDNFQNLNLSLIFDDDNGHQFQVDYYPNNPEKSLYAKYEASVKQESTGLVRPALRVLIPAGSFFYTGKLYYYTKERFDTTSEYPNIKEVVNSDYQFIYTGVRLINEAYDALPTLSDPIDNSNPDRKIVELEVKNRIAGGGTSDHRNLTNRDAEYQHPISAITNLGTALINKTNIVESTTPPQDRRDLILSAEKCIWIDTAGGKRVMKIYNSDTNSWEAVSGSADNMSEYKTVYFDPDNFIPINGEDTIYIGSKQIKANEKSIIYRVYSKSLNVLDGNQFKIMVGDVEYTGTDNSEGVISFYGGNYQIYLNYEGIYFKNNTSSDIDLRSISYTGSGFTYRYTILDAEITENSFIDFRMSQETSWLAYNYGLIPEAKFSNGKMEFTFLDAHSDKQIKANYLVLQSKNISSAETFEVQNYLGTFDVVPVFKDYTVDSTKWVNTKEVQIYTGEKPIPATKERTLILGDYSSLFDKLASDFKLVIGSTQYTGETATKTTTRYIVTFDNGNYELTCTSQKVKVRNNTQNDVIAKRLSLVNSGLFSYVINDKNTNNDSFIIFIVRKNSAEVARAAGVFISGSFEEGKMTLFSANRPTEDLEAEYMVMMAINEDNLNSFYVQNMDYTHEEVKAMVIGANSKWEEFNNGGVFPATYQSKTDLELRTTSKQIAGAINEVNAKIGNVDYKEIPANTDFNTLTEVGRYKSITGSTRFGYTNTPDDNNLGNFSENTLFLEIDKNSDGTSEYIIQTCKIACDDFTCNSLAMRSYSYVSSQWGAWKYAIKGGKDAFELLGEINNVLNNINGESF